MKTDDLIQLALVGVISYMAYQKFGHSKVPPPPSTSSTPYVPPVDFGVTNPNDASWGDNPQGQGFVDQLISQATSFTL